MKIFRGIVKGILLKGENTDPSDNKEGSVWHNRVLSRLKTFIEGDVREILTDSQAQTLTNKTINAPDNTITGLEAVDISYDNSLSELPAINVQDAIDEVNKLAVGIGPHLISLYDPISTILPSGASAIIDGVPLQNGDDVLFSNLSSGNNRIYRASGVGVSIVWTVRNVFLGLPDPVASDQVLPQDGLLFAQQTGIFNGFGWSFNDTVKYFNGTDYFEQSSIRSVALVNNTTAPVFTVAVSGSQNFVMDCSITRGSAKETFQLIVSSDGITADVVNSGAVVSSVGVSFSAVIVGLDLVLRYTTDASGSSGEMKFSYKRWSDAAGGPAGVPSYSPASDYYATTTLNNLQSPTAINQNILPDSDNTIDLGSISNNFKDIYVNSIKPSSNLNLNNSIISNVLDPINPQDVATKTYVDSNSGGNAKTSLVLANNSSGNILTLPLTTSNIKMTYSIERDGNKFFRDVFITHNGVDVGIAEAGTDIGDVGVEIVVSLTTDTEINYITTNTGIDANMTYVYTSWED